MTGAPDLQNLNVEEWNDRLAREHDIDNYYTTSGGIIVQIERHRLRLIRRLMAPKPGEKLLEVGCGGGHVLREFPECDLTGVDVSGEMLAKAKANLASLLKVRLIKGDLTHAGLEPHSFDGIICTEVLEHVVEPEAILAQFKRLLKPGGRAVITLPNDTLVNGIKDAIKATRLTWLPPFKRISWGGEHFHFHVWTIPQMREMLSRHLTVVDEAFAPSRLFPIRCCFLCRAPD